MERKKKKNVKKWVHKKQSARHTGTARTSATHVHGEETSKIWFWKAFTPNKHSLSILKEKGYATWNKTVFVILTSDEYKLYKLAVNLPNVEDALGVETELSGTGSASCLPSFQ